MPVIHAGSINLLEQELPTVPRVINQNCTSDCAAFRSAFPSGAEINSESNGVLR
jgi:type II secretory pathway predicted ATPase ExeA